MTLCLTIIYVIANAILVNAVAPNIIFVVVDDVGWADIGFTGHGVIRTPFIDSLSSRGVRFFQHYVHPTCSPTRASLMTGKYSYKAGLSFAVFPGSPAGLDQKALTFPRVMRNAGYRTYASGKW
jgi:arylsulfatase A-like enzyme